MITNYHEIIKRHLTQEQFFAQLESIKQRIKNENSETEISEPIISEKQYYFDSENIKFFGKSYISTIKLNNVTIAHLEYFKTNNNDFFDFNIRP